jgi:hypothetical protein
MKETCPATSRQEKLNICVFRIIEIVSYRGNLLAENGSLPWRFINRKFLLLQTSTESIKGRMNCVSPY